MTRMVSGVVSAGLLPVIVGAATIDLVTVGDPGNPPDPTTGYGTVSNAYDIGEFEVTNEQYAEFLNAVAATDTYKLYNSSMHTSAKGGISQLGVSGSYTYTTKTNMGNKPATYVSFYDAARFVNWLQNGQPTGPQGTATTETGSYTLFTSGATTTNVGARWTTARWVIPTENEWYKAAYYDPGPSGPSDDYWLYPTRSDSAPTIATANSVGDISNPGTNVANRSYGADWNGQDGNVTTVGSAGAGSESHYGTFDQGGNLYEWNQTIIGTDRGVRGGSWANSDVNQRSSYRSFTAGPTYESEAVGFRVALVPVSESSVPPSLSLALSAGGPLQLTLAGSLGQAFEIEVSGTLMGWDPWLSITLSVETWTTNFAHQAELPRRFWRARLVE